MKRIVLLILLAGISSAGYCQKIFVAVSGGYSKQYPISKDYISRPNNKQTMTYSSSGGSGSYFGADVKLLGKKSVGLNIGLYYQSFSIYRELESRFISVSGQTTVANRVDSSKSSFVQFSPGITVLSRKGPITVSGVLGLDINFKTNAAYKTNYGFYPSVAIGYKGILVSAAYHVGLSNIYEHSDEYPDQATAKSGLLNVGLSIIPQLFFQ